MTTYGLGIGKQPGEIEFSTREPMTICATEEAARVLKYCGAKVHYLERMNELRRQFPEQHICVELDTPKVNTLLA
ncbi:hypothetical protein [Nostoc sp.]|uniref:hypothetical protein n=1 Tax=Nostoc sp. TaxID=1180 RepID=UPI003FA5DEBC